MYTPSESKYHYFLVAVNCNDFGVAVWLTCMVDETCLIARHCGIHYFISINTEHVAANTLQEERRGMRVRKSEREREREREEEEEEMLLID